MDYQQLFTFEKVQTTFENIHEEDLDNHDAADDHDFTPDEDGFSKDGC